MLFQQYKSERDRERELSLNKIDIPAFMPAMFLNGVRRSMNTMPMLKIWTPPPDMYSMNACMGRDFAGAMANSQARFSFRDA